MFNTLDVNTPADDPDRIHECNRITTGVLHASALGISTVILPCMSRSLDCRHAHYKFVLTAKRFSGAPCGGIHAMFKWVNTSAA